MGADLIPFGEPLPDLNPDHLNYAISKKVLSLCAASTDFQVVQLRRLLRNDKSWDLIVVDCINDQVASRNAIGIKVRERVALAFTANALPEVRALRKHFPTTVSHLNHVSAGEPVSLCLYSEPWNTLERTWTAQRHLQRILWWLTETSKEKLHRDDQPPEPLYFHSPFQIVLPLDFEEKMEKSDLVLIPIPIPVAEQPHLDFKVIRGVFQNKAHIETREPGRKNVSSVPIIGPGSGRYIAKGGLFAPIVQPEKAPVLQYELLPLKIPPIVHGVIEQYPNTLGQLYDQIERRGDSILNGLKNAVKERAQGGVSRDASSRCLLILWVPMKRSNDSEAETTMYAFELISDLAGLGELIGVLTKSPDGKFYPISLLGEAAEDQTEGWRQIGVFPIAVSREVDRDFARIASGINTYTADFKGVLAGVGALGSALAELWAKEHWGQWSLIDPDFIKPHNIVRHIAKDNHVGSFKVDVVKGMMEMNYARGYYHATALRKNADDLDAEEVKNAIVTAEFFVDATTTIEIPRDVSQRDDAPRSVSAFLTPSGQGSALLIESADRSLRLDALEAQYYRGIIDSEWGAEHLNTSQGNLRIGSGCRDVSAIISNEAIEFHAALLARQIRLLRDRSESHIRAWSADFETGALTAHEVPIHPSSHFHCGDWQAILDTGIQEKLYELRRTQLPNETGGVILGYIDQKLKHIYVVDVLQAPPDSDADRTGFTRGVEGLKAALDEVARRTANIVGYLGEWHSHPAFTSAYPSGTDRALIEQLSNALDLDGQPALMLIVGTAGDVSLSVKG